MNKFIVLVLLATSALAVPVPESGGNLDCLNHEDMLSCIAVKAVSALGRAARSKDIKLMDGVQFVLDGPIERSARVLETEKETETDVMNTLPREVTERTLKLASMLYESAMSFLKNHSLKVNMPEGAVSRAMEEGRVKIKKTILPFLPIIGAIGVKMLALVPIALGGLALLVIKALFVGKIALLLAGILGFQKLFGGGPSGESFFSKAAQPVASWAAAAAPQSWSSAPSASQSQGYYRSFDSGDAHDLAYSAQAPKEAQ